MKSDDYWKSIKEDWKKHTIELKDNKWILKFKNDKLKDHTFTSKTKLEEYLDWLENATYV
jgi:hypothetical protein|tara:strand:+ start:428 stop:607 length:180 start_codon:yes stop_codon:yes gene_type:complete